MKIVLVANRGEIAVRVFRACTELGIKTVGIYAEEDEYSVHRFKADEAYLVGQGKKPIDAYLDIEGIISIAKECGADAIHPGYGLLSENLNFAQRCEEEGITFVGPKLHHLDIFGDKIKAKAAANEAGIASIPGTDGPIASVDDALEFAERFGYPIMIKAALGGGGRGMRVAHDEKSAREGYERQKAKQKLPLVAMKCMLKNTSPTLSISKYRFLVTHMETSSIFSKETVLFSAATKK